MTFPKYYSFQAEGKPPVVLESAFSERDFYQTHIKNKIPDKELGACSIYEISKEEYLRLKKNAVH